jgi:hypothetical protein
MVSFGALSRGSVLALILGSNYPDSSISVSDICKVFPVSFLRESCEKSLRHSSFSPGTYLQKPRNREIPCKFPCYQGIANGDRFVSDCAHHHSKSLNRLRLPRSLRSLREIENSAGPTLVPVGDFRWQPFASIETDGRYELSYRQILVTAGPVRRRRLWADGQRV